MSEDRMQGIPRYALDLNQMTCGRDGDYVRYEDASSALQKLRDALEKLTIRHFESCNCVINDDMHEPCDCGVDEARAALREAK